ncbi:MAG TPA: hypothetical protein DCY07_03910 [Rhodospirillaceae bacterium]|nr:hypothetical protein [Rhodospirillaceae bacterium]
MELLANEEYGLVSNLTERRKFFAAIVSKVIDPLSKSFVSCPARDNCYVVDQGNNWVLSFEKGQKVNLSYRYQNKDGFPHEEIAAAWLAAKNIAYPTKSFTIEVKSDGTASRPSSVVMAAKYGPDRQP